MSYVVIGGRLLVAGIFLLSLLSKVRGRAAYCRFVTATADLAGVRDRVARPLAAATVAFEAAIVVLVVLPITPVVGFTLAVTLLTAFTVGLARASRRSDPVRCHCFGTSSTPVSIRQVARNVVLIAVVALLAALTVGAPHEPVGLGGVAIAALVALPSALTVAHLDDLIDVLRPSIRKL
ncbi:hypothetical protein Nm8I071_23480 [Nonomuraea sp. TT08I-71]|nr:hypothetical protein Nm8I071_23480 [Nonomuraea sp. TT08I-71]